MTNSFYDLKAISLKGKETSMADFKGKVILVVNTASKWNFTKFLLDRNGEVIGRYGSIVTPAKLEAEILKLL